MNKRAWLGLRKRNEKLWWCLAFSKKPWMLVPWGVLTASASATYIGTMRGLLRGRREQIRSNSISAAAVIARHSATTGTLARTRRRLWQQRADGRNYRQLQWTCRDVIVTSVWWGDAGAGAPDMAPPLESHVELRTYLFYCVMVNWFKPAFSLKASTFCQKIISEGIFKSTLAPPRRCLASPPPSATTSPPSQYTATESPRSRRGVMMTSGARHGDDDEKFDVV